MGFESARRSNSDFISFTSSTVPGPRRLFHVFGGMWIRGVSPQPARIILSSMSIVAQKDRMQRGQFDRQHWQHGCGRLRMRCLRSRDRLA